MWIVLLIHMTFANTLMVKAPSVDDDTYHVFLENSDNVRPSDMEQACNEMEGLQQTYANANDNFLNGSVEMAKKQFADVAEKQWRCDWRKRERTTISEAFLRLAQMASSTEDKKDHLTALAHFDPSYRPAASLFPPPLVDEWIALTKLQRLKTISTNKYSGMYVKVLRNGQPHTIGKDSLQFPSGQARYTFLSDSHAPKTLIIGADELSHVHIQSTALISGDCKSFQFQKPVQWKGDVRLFFAPECIVERPENILLASKGMMTASPALSTNAIDLQLAEDRVPKKPWIQRNAVWIGTAAAIVGAALIVSHMNKNKETQTVITPSNSMNNN